MSLKEERTKRGLSLHQLADKSGVHYIKIHQIEREVIKPENMSLKNAARLANALDCDPRAFLTSEEFTKQNQ